MHRSFPYLAAGLGWLAITVALPAGPPVPAPDGDWVLVEQTYGDGRANLADPDQPLCLELTRKNGRLSGQIRRGRSASARHDWPVWVEGQHPVPVATIAAAEDRLAGTFEVRYRVPPRPGDDLTLEVFETYRLEEDGNILIGRVEVSFERNGKRRGSYILHRRFERMP